MADIRQTKETLLCKFSVYKYYALWSGQGAFPITKRQGFIVETVGKWIMAVGSVVASYFFGGWSGVQGASLVFGALHYLTGFAVAAMTGTLKNNMEWLGIARKALIFAMVVVGHLVDGILGDGHMFRMQSSFLYRE
ncbi:phage-related holin [Paenibacillus sp. W4I10]|uniref:phage holin family protein n=1 Tax=Paenibacillus sp. W4I10 TaxID=3042298 RepID=UPI00278AD68F|nr:phage holin family protein [Paenibacillus sp. W4I10]MDQ0722232.1 phage-related holin [Paenibacillus sp. W4I10]